MDKFLKTYVKHGFVPSLAVLLILVSLLIYMPTQASRPTTYEVNSTSDNENGPCNAVNCTLREAITAANNSPGADIINFSLSPNATIILNGNELPRITDDLTIDGRTAVNLTISANDASRIVVIGDEPPTYPGPGESSEGVAPVVTFYNLTFTNGGPPANLGGGIFNNGVLSLIDSTVQNMNSVFGGGVYNQGTLTITRSLFTDNAVVYRGGGIYNNTASGMTIRDSIFTNNISVNSWAGNGGAIYNARGDLSVIDSEFTGNHASDGGQSRGGAIFNTSFDDFSIEGSTFISNTAVGSGGAISNNNGSSPPGLITNSTFQNNSAYSGGAIHAGGGFTIEGSTFVENIAQTHGGAIAVSGSTFVINSTFQGNMALTGDGGAIRVTGINWLRLLNSTISESSAVNGGGLMNDAQLYIRNSIIANSLSGGDCLSTGTIPSNVSNLIEDGSCNAAFSGDPLLGPLGNYGGPTLTLWPQSGSLAVDNGDDDFCEIVDQRGWLRPIDGDDDGTAVCDIGAVEVNEWIVFLPEVLYSAVTNSP